MDGWEPRTIALVADRARTDEICSEWVSTGWRVLSVERTEPSAAGHECHRVTVAVPPVR